MFHRLRVRVKVRVRCAVVLIVSYSDPQLLFFLERRGKLPSNFVNPAAAAAGCRLSLPPSRPSVVTPFFLEVRPTFLLKTT